MGYTRKCILEKCNNALIDIRTFYKQDFINYRGKTIDTNELCSEIISKFVCDNINLFYNTIPQITREKSYKTEGHNGEYNKCTNRIEEVIAMQMFKQGTFSQIGQIIDYQIPLKNKRGDKAGKIDLLSYDGEKLRVLELKKPDSEETMLRCVLEGYTYLKTMNIRKLLDDFNLPINTEVIACPFVFRGREQHKEMKENRPYLFELMRLLNSKPYYITLENQIYVVEE